MNLFLRKLLLNNYHYYLLLVLSIICSFFFIKFHKSYLLAGDVKLTGKVEEYFIEGNTLSMIIFSKEKIKCTYYIKNEDEKNILINNIKYGLTLELNGTLSEPLNNTIPNSFSYKNYLKSNNIYLSLLISDFEIVDNKISLINKIKNTIYKKVNKLDNKDYVLTFTLGNYKLIDNEVLKSYQTNGTIHLFSVSGMHVSLFSLILLFILEKFKVKENTRIVLVILFISFYAVLTGLSPSIVRATGFFILIKLNKIFYTEIKTINLYILVIAISLFIFPYFLINIGFQYSALTCFGLIYSSEHLKKGSYFTKMLKTSIVATLFSIIITINNFYEFNVLSIFCNLIFIPLITFIIYPISLIVIFLPYLAPLLKILIDLTENLSLIMESRGIIINLPKMHFIHITIYYLSLIIIIKHKIKLIYISVLIILFSKMQYLFDNNYHIYYLDVGQGDSVILRSPLNKEIIMIDTGGKLEFSKEKWQEKNKTFNISDASISFLKSIGVTKIDLLILSHGDADHLGDALNFISKIKVENIILNKNAFNSNEAKILKKAKLNYNYTSKNFNIYNYYPKTTSTDENDNSIITFLNIKNNNFLFMGDASKETEKLFIKEVSKLEVDIIKLGHHGSKTSTSNELINYFNPKMAVVSAGRNNRYNHPSKETMDLINEKYIDVFNTQINGTIEVIIRAKALSFITYSP